MMIRGFQQSERCVLSGQWRDCDEKLLPTSQKLPLNPSGQEHWKVERLRPFMQVPPFWQGSGLQGETVPKNDKWINEMVVEDIIKKKPVKAPFLQSGGLYGGLHLHSWNGGVDVTVQLPWPHFTFLQTSFTEKKNGWLFFFNQKCKQTQFHF